MLPPKRAVPILIRSLKLATYHIQMSKHFEVMEACMPLPKEAVPIFVN